MCMYYENVFIEDYANWPVLPYTEGEAFGVDVVGNTNYDVYAAGFWQKMIQFYPLPTLTTGTNSWFDTYLVKIDKCGNPIWQTQIGTPMNTIYVGGIGVTSICLDNHEDIVMCGTYESVANFPNSSSTFITLTSPSSMADRNGFVAKFDKNTGYCLWAAKLEGAREDFPRGVTADLFGYIYVLGDFTSNQLGAYSSTNMTTTPDHSVNNITTSGTNGDNFISMYDTYGANLDLQNLIVSTTHDDKSGGICCYDRDPKTTIIHVTGRKGNDFLGQEWKYDQTITTLSFVSDYSIPAANGGNESHFGHAVEVLYDNGNGVWQVNFAGDVYSANGTNPFFGFRQTSDINSTLQYCNDFISTTPTTNNRALDFCINKFTGEVLFGGYMNEAGDHPASPLNTYGLASLNCYVARLFDLSTGSAIKSIATQQAQINKKQLILIYPNPTKGLVFFQSPVTNDCLNKFELTTVNGQSLNESVNFVTQDGQNSIDLSNLKKGMYYLKTYWDSGTQINKVVLQ